MVKRIQTDAGAAAQAANRVPEKGEGSAVVRDGMARMLLALAAAVSHHASGRRFSLPLIEAANSIRCGEEVKKEIEKGLACLSPHSRGVSARAVQDARGQLARSVEDKCAYFENGLRGLIGALCTGDPDGTKRKEIVELANKATEFATAYQEDAQEAARIREKVAEMLTAVARIASKLGYARGVAATIAEAVTRIPRTARTTQGASGYTKCPVCGAVISLSASAKNNGCCRRCRDNNDASTGITVLFAVALFVVVVAIVGSSNSPNRDDGRNSRSIADSRDDSHIVPDALSLSNEGTMEDRKPTSPALADWTEQESVGHNTMSQGASPPPFYAPPTPAAAPVTFPFVFGELPTGFNELVIDNRELADGVRAMVRSGGRGNTVRVAAFGHQTIALPAGQYEIYFIFDSDGNSLYQGDSFSLRESGNYVDSVTLVLKKRVGGNYNVRKVE
jgi:hypothetical protein